MIGSFAFIGVAVGLLLGITGAGGAIVAIPLFVFLTGITVRDATTVSLLAVCVGAILNWIIQWRHTDFGLGVGLFLFSLAGASLLKPVKAISPDWVILALFAGVGAASLVSVWRKRTSRDAAVEKPEASKGAQFLRVSFGGFSLGGLVTMTGLGGGVVLVPFLTGFFPLTMSKAAATSLFTIALTSMFSMWIQWESIASVVQVSSGLALVAGSLAAAVATRQLLKKVRPEVLDRARRVLVTMVIAGSVVSLVVFNENGRTLGMNSIHMSALKEKYAALGAGEVILDVRTAEEYAESHVPGAKNINHEDVEKRASELRQYQRIYVYCRSGKRAQIAVDLLAKQGIQNLVLIKGSGMMDWTELGYPIEKGRAQ